MVKTLLVKKLLSYIQMRVRTRAYVRARAQ